MIKESSRIIQVRIDHYLIVFLIRKLSNNAETILSKESHKSINDIYITSFLGKDIYITFCPRELDIYLYIMKHHICCDDRHCKFEQL
jgi:hypothetical protein